MQLPTICAKLCLTFRPARRLNAWMPLRNITQLLNKRWGSFAFHCCQTKSSVTGVESNAVSISHTKCQIKWVFNTSESSGQCREKAHICGSEYLRSLGNFNTQIGNENRLAISKNSLQFTSIKLWLTSCWVLLLGGVCVQRHTRLIGVLPAW